MLDKSNKLEKIQAHEINNTWKIVYPEQINKIEENPDGTIDRYIF